MLDIDNILKLSRLKLPEEEKRKIEKEFSSALDFVKKLQDIDVSEVEPLKYIEEISNIARDDNDLDSQNKDNPQMLVDLAPDKKEGYIKTKQIL